MAGHVSRADQAGPAGAPWQKGGAGGPDPRPRSQVCMRQRARCAGGSLTCVCSVTCCVTCCVTCFSADELWVVRPPHLPGCRLPGAVRLAGRWPAHPRAHPRGLPPAAGERQPGRLCGHCHPGLVPASWLFRGSPRSMLLVEGHSRACNNKSVTCALHLAFFPATGGQADGVADGRRHQGGFP